MQLSDEDREIITEGLEALMRRLRDNVRPRPDRAKEYSPNDARRYYRAEELIGRMRLG